MYLEIIVKLNYAVVERCHQLEWQDSICTSLTWQTDHDWLNRNVCKYVDMYWKESWDSSGFHICMDDMSRRVSLCSPVGRSLVDTKL